MRTDALKRALEHLENAKQLLVEAGVAPQGGLVQRTEALHQQVAVLAEVAEKRVA